MCVAQHNEVFLDRGCLGILHTYSNDCKIIRLQLIHILLPSKSYKQPIKHCNFAESIKSNRMFRYDLQHWGKETHTILFISVRARSTEFLQYITVLIWMSWQNCHSASGFLHADLRTWHWEYANSVHVNTMWLHCYSRCGVVLTASGADLWVWFDFSYLSFHFHCQRLKKKYL